MATFPFDQPEHEPPTEQSVWEQQSGEQQYQMMGGYPQTPPIDILDNSDELWVFVDLPGFQQDEIHVRGDESTLLVSADRLDELEEGRAVMVQERPTRVERTIQLPSPVEISSADLTYDDGVCKIVLPKAASERFTELSFHEA